MTIDWPELVKLLPIGWELREDPDVVYLVDPEGKVKRRWSALGASKESILEDIREFFAEQERR